MAECNCYVGIWNEVDNSYLVTLDELKANAQLELENAKKWNYKVMFTLLDYCDRRKSTNLTRFEYCPFCGKKIDWKAIRRDAE